MPDHLKELKIAGNSEAKILIERKGECTTVDIRLTPQPVRHGKILEIFDKMSPGERLLVINDHEPVHLLKFMKHERKDFDPTSYRAYQRGPREWIGEFHKTSAAEAHISDHIKTSFDTERVYGGDSFSPVPVFTDSGYRVILTYIRAGQFIPVHAPASDLVFLIHKGSGTAVAGESTYQIGPGDILVVKKGVKRGIKAETDMEALHLVIPPPGDRDHEEVGIKIAEGKFE